MLPFQKRGIRNATLATATGGGNREQGLAPRSKSAAAKAAPADFGYRKRRGRKTVIRKIKGDISRRKIGRKGHSSYDEVRVMFFLAG